MASKYVLVHDSAARTATPTAVQVDTGAHKGMLLEIDVTAIAATPSVVANINHVGVSGNQLLLASAAITGTGTTFMTVYPGIADAANVAANDVTGLQVEIDMVHGDTDSITYSVHAQLID